MLIKYNFQLGICLLTNTPSMTTATPAGWIAWVTATAICFVNRSWTKTKNKLTNKNYFKL